LPDPATGRPRLDLFLISFSGLLLELMPMMFSGLLFIRSFQQTDRRDEAFGANLIGALVGGLLQPITYAVGMKALLLVVAAVYVGALLTRPVERPEAKA
jgi:hypothetical protein